MLKLRSSMNMHIRNELIVQIKIKEDPGEAIQEVADVFGDEKRIKMIYRKHVKKAVLKCNKAYRKSVRKQQPIKHKYASLA